MMPTGSKTIPSGSLTSAKVILPIHGTSNSIQPKLMLRRANPSSYCASHPTRGTSEMVRERVRKGLHVLYISWRLIEMSLQLMLAVLQHMTLSSSLAWGTTTTAWGGRRVMVLDLRSRYIKQKRIRWDKRRHAMRTDNWDEKDNKRWEKTSRNKMWGLTNKKRRNKMWNHFTKRRTGEKWNMHGAEKKTDEKNGGEKGREHVTRDELKWC